MKFKLKLIIPALLFPVMAMAQSQPQVIPLWEKGAPGFEDRKDIPGAGKRLLGPEY
jgi:hypothetical protein